MEEDKGLSKWLNRGEIMCLEETVDKVKTMCKLAGCPASEDHKRLAASSMAAKLFQNVKYPNAAVFNEINDIHLTQSGHPNAVGAREVAVKEKKVMDERIANLGL